MKQSQHIQLKTPDDIKRIGEAGRIIALIFERIQHLSLRGMSTFELDAFVEEEIHRHRARSSFKTVINYGYATCISVNSEVVHGIPSKKKLLQLGDIVKIDIGVVKRGFFADACRTVVVEPISENARQLVMVARSALEKGIEVMFPGRHMGDIGSAIQRYVESSGYSIVRDFSGHGVGFSVHELPAVPHFGKERSGMELQEGMVLAVEPIVNEGGREVISLEDGWTVATADGKLSAQFENTIAITGRGPVVLTR